MKKLIGICGTALVAAVLCFSLFACTPKKALKLIDIPLTMEDYAFAVQKGNPVLMAQANELIAELKADGSFNTLITKYMSEDQTDFVKFENPTEAPDLATQLVVATSADFPPFESMLGNKFTGVDVEVAMMLANKVGKPLYIANMNFNAVVLSVSGTTTPPAPEEGEEPIKIPTTAHVGMAGLTISEDRKLVVDFTESYFTSSQMIIVQEGDTTFDACTTADEVMAILTAFDNKTKIGFQSGTTGQFFTEEYSVEAKGYDSGVQAAQDLQVGRINYVVIDLKPAQSIVTRLNAILG